MNLAKIPLRTFLITSDALTMEQVAPLLELPKPRVFGRYDVPDSLNGLMLGELFELQSMTQPIIEPATLLFGCTDVYVMNRPTAEVFAFNNWVGSELKRIAQLFDSIPSRLSSEEIRAGVENLKFGLFGMADSYAKRMGIIDHDYVLQCVPWLRVWQCLKNDAETAMYDRRLRKIYSETK